MNSFHQTALQYHDAGLVVIPWWFTAEDKVGFPSWSKYQYGQSKEEVNQLFSSAEKVDGIAVVCTNGMEVIDIDVKADPKREIAKEFFQDLFWRTGSDEIREKCLIVRTKSKGWHVIYKAPNVEGNQKLARRVACKEAMIETRGPGGLVFVAPSPGYEVKQGSYLNIPLLTAQERDAMIDTAVSLDENPEVAPEAPKPTPKKTEAKAGENILPGDDYTQKTDLLALMEGYGWKHAGTSPSGRIHLSKPGASNPRDTHAVIIQSNDNTDILHPFTTGSEFEARRNYNAFAVYTLLEHYGNYHEAAKALREQGYGSDMPKQKEQKTKKQEKAPTDLLAFVRSTKFDVNAPIEEEEAILSISVESKTYKVAGRGQMGVVVGEQKSGKSLVTSCIAAAGLSGKPILNFSMSLDKGMEYYDTEQSSYFYKLTQKRLHDLAGLRANHPAYAAYLLRRLSIKDRVAVIDEMLKDRQDLSCIIIDGVVDLCTNFNDEVASIEIADKLLQWSDQTGATIITVLHLTKSMGYLRGHLGTALQNKADFVIQVNQDKSLGLYTVECRESRFSPFKSFEFTRDERGWPVLDKHEGEDIDDEPKGGPAISVLPSRKVADNMQIPF